MEEMKFEILKMETPSVPEFNFEELKKDLQEKTTKYEKIIYNDDEISQAKKDRADLNKLKKAINDKRIAMEKDYMRPFNEFKDKVKEIIDIIDKPIEAIDTQVKQYEMAAIEAKKQWIIALFDKENPFNWLKYEQIFNNKWLNASTSKKSIEDEMRMTFNMVETDLKSIETLDYCEQAVEVYKKTLSMTKVLERVAELKEFDKALAEQKAKTVQVEEPKQEEPKVDAKVEVKEEPKAAEPKEWMQMEICLSAEDFDKFDAWTKENKIEWRIR